MSNRDSCRLPEAQFSASRAGSCWSKIRPGLEGESTPMDTFKEFIDSMGNQGARCG